MYAKSPEPRRSLHDVGIAIPKPPVPAKARHGPAAGVPSIPQLRNAPAREWKAKDKDGITEVGERHIGTKTLSLPDSLVFGCSLVVRG